MIYTLVTSAKEWLSERFAQDGDAENGDEVEGTKDEIIVPHVEPVTIDTFLAWRERFEAELALERAKLMPDSALTAPKEKEIMGRQWFESGRATAKGAASIYEGSDEDEEDIDFDDDDFEDEPCLNSISYFFFSFLIFQLGLSLFLLCMADDEEDMLEHCLAEKSDTSSHSSRRAD